MEFLDRKEELAELKRVLNPETPPRFVVIYGRRRLGKSTLTESSGLREMEFDVIAESRDGSALLVGECKWTNPEQALPLINRLKDKSVSLPLAQNKEIIPVLFLKNRPKDLEAASNIKILYPEDVISLSYGEIESFES